MNDLLTRVAPHLYVIDRALVFNAQSSGQAHSQR
jgi:hypothetical protein